MKPTEYPKKFLNSKLTGNYYDWVVSSIEESDYDVSELLGNKKIKTILNVYEASKKLKRKRKNKKQAKKLGDELSTIVKECHSEFVETGGSKKVNEKVKKSLIRVGKNIEKVDENVMKKGKKVEFANAIIDGDLEKLKQLVNEFDVNEKLDNNLGTPLFLALDSGKYDVASFLIQKGANINEKSGDVSIIIKAVWENDYESVRLLSDMGADLSYKDEKGYNVFNHAIMNNNFNIFKKLMERFEIGVHDGEFKINDTGSKGNLLCFAIGNLKESSESNEKENTKKIIGNIIEKYSHYEINSGMDGNTSLFYAIQKNDVEVAEMLIDAGANAKIKLKDGKTLYNFAKSIGDKEMVKVVGKNLSFIDKILG